MEILKSLNEYAGLLALFALLAAVIIPFIIYNKGKRDARRAAQDELDSMDDMPQVTIPWEERGKWARRSFLEKQVNKRRRR